MVIETMVLMVCIEHYVLKVKFGSKMTRPNLAGRDKTKKREKMRPEAGTRETLQQVKDVTALNLTVNVHIYHLTSRSSSSVAI